MSQNEVKECPDAATLTDYLMGQLEPPTLEQCESHIADCNSCHETLRGLSVEDTLSEHVAGAFLQATGSDSFKADLEEDVHVRGLVDRLLTQTVNQSLEPKRSAADAEVLADRAAEVLRCVEPDSDNQTLGSIGDYQLIRLIGAGSTGVVFQAIDQKLDRTVALKVLRPSLGSVARERFIAEARLAASIEHPNVVTIYQIDQFDRLAFIAMQWLPGQTLETKLQSTATMVDEDVRRIAAQVAAGLQAAHQRQLVHRDIKPANVWISDDEGVKILDFGLARIVDDNPGLTATGMLAGTPNFMSPEQTKGHELDGRSDLFSLGCMMYRMATGKLAFGATSILGTLQAIQHEQPTPPKLVNVEISGDVSDLTMSLLEKQPANRPESAAHVVTMLEAERHQWPVNVGRYDAANTSTPPEQVNPSTTKRNRRSSGQSSLAGESGWYQRIAAVIATMLLALAGWYFSPQIIRIATDQGELVIEAEDKDVEVQILRDGKVVRVLDTKTKNSFNIESGDYQIKATGEGNSFAVTPDSLTMKRGQQTVVSVTKQPNANAPMAETETAPPHGLSAGKFIVGKNGQVTVIGTEEETQRAIALLQKTSDSAVHNNKSDALLQPSAAAGKIESLELLSAELKWFEQERRKQLAQLDAKHPHIVILDRRIKFLKQQLDNPQEEATRFERYSVTTDPKVAFDTLSRLLRGRDSWAINQDPVTGELVVNGEEADHQIVSKALAKLAETSPKPSHTELVKRGFAFPSDIASRSKNHPMYKGKPFKHWINITKTERSREMLCDALLAGAELAETAEEKAALLDVTRTLARKHGTTNLAHKRGTFNDLDSSSESVQYFEALVKAINVLDATEIIQFVLDELENGTPQSVGLCSCLFEYRWNEAYDIAFFERAPELLKLIVAQIEAGRSRAENRHALLGKVIQTLIGRYDSGVRFAGGGSRAYVSGVHEERVARAMVKTPTLAAIIRQLFFKSSATTRVELVGLTRAFWPNDKEVELAIQSSMLDPSLSVGNRNWFYQIGVGDGNSRQTYWDFLYSSPKPIAVEALRKLLDNQSGPEDQRITVVDSVDEIEGRPATLSYILKSLETLRAKHPNDTDEDVVPAIGELLERIVAIEKTDDPTLKHELDDFKTLGIFKYARKMLDEIGATTEVKRDKKTDADAGLPKGADADTENVLSLIRRIDPKIAEAMGKDNAIKSRFGAESPEHDGAILTQLLEMRQQAIDRLPPEHRSQIADVVPVPYQAEPPKKQLKGLDSLEFDWTGYDHLKSRIEMGSFESWDEQIMQDSISREKLAMRLDEEDPEISHTDRRLNAFKTVVNHLKKANGLPVIDLSKAETKSLIKQRVAKEIELTKLLKTYGPKHPSVKVASKRFDELQEKLREITYGVSVDD